MIPKFRAWYVLAEEMIDEILVISFVRKEIIGKFRDGSTSVPLKFEDKRNGEDVILMQSTGLFDKNGVEIFEGDILKDDSESGKVVYDPDRTMWRVYGKDFDDALSDWWIGRVIGNIYENPELMEGNA